MNHESFSGTVVMACCLMAPSHFLNQCLFQNIAIHSTAILKKMCQNTVLTKDTLIWARGIILCMGSANEWRHCYVTSSLIGWAHTQNDPLVMGCWINILDQIDCIIMRHIPFCNYYHINTSQLPPLGGHFNIKMLALTSIGIPFIKIRSMA